MINKITSEKTAVIVIDLQNDYVDEEGKISRWGLGTKNLQEKLPKIKSFIEKARQERLQIIHIQMTEGRDSISSELKKERIEKFGDASNWELAIPGTWGHKLILNVKNNEKIFEKNNLDIFSNPTLETHLRENKIEQIIILGAYTHACVNASVRSASAKGFKVILTQDLVGSQDKLISLHEDTLKVLTNSIATGLSSEEIIKELLN